MKLAQMTWQDVENCSRDEVVLIPTGSLEQHGAHLPLFTDSLIVTAVSEAIEAQLPGNVILTPTLWLGASAHHLAFPGTLSAGFNGYMEAISSVVESLKPHGFRKFYVINGHGGNTDPNMVALRALKAKYPELTFGHADYYKYASDVTAASLRGPAKEMHHACEAEVSLMLLLHPGLVRTEKLRDDGLEPEPSVPGVIHHFDEITEAGSLGYATFGTAEVGQAIFDAAVNALISEIHAVASGYVLVSPKSPV